MLAVQAPPKNSSIPEVAMRTYARLGAFIKACYGEGSSASPSALASTDNGCMSAAGLHIKH